MKQTGRAKALPVCLVRAKGLEPSRRGHQILSLARLPIPPCPQSSLIIHFSATFVKHKLLLRQKSYRQVEIFRYRFGRFLHSVCYPPSQRIDEHRTDMVEPEIIGQSGTFPLCENRQLICRHFSESLFEIFEKDVVVLARQKYKNIIIVLLQMPEKVEKCGIGRVAVENVSMIGAILL